jgi:hypothetical protein
MRPCNYDGVHVEQKNWAHLRELVGYLRFDTREELELLNVIWTLDEPPSRPAKARRTLTRGFEDHQVV